MATSDTVKNYNKVEIITLKYYNSYDLLFALGGKSWLITGQHGTVEDIINSLMKDAALE